MRTITLCIRLNFSCRSPYK